MKQVQQPFEKRLKLYGLVIASILASLTLLGIIFSFCDKKYAEPYVCEKAEAAIIKYHKPFETRDSVWKMGIENEIKSDKIMRRAEYKIIRAFQEAQMMESQKRNARDQLLRDTTIPKDMVY